MREVTVCGGVEANSTLSSVLKRGGKGLRCRPAWGVSRVEKTKKGKTGEGVGSAWTGGVCGGKTFS